MTHPLQEFGGHEIVTNHSLLRLEHAIFILKASDMLGIEKMYTELQSGATVLNKSFSIGSL